MIDWDDFTSNTDSHSGTILTQLLFVSGSVVVVVVTSMIKFTYGISARAEAGSSSWTGFHDTVLMNAARGGEAGWETSLH